MAVQRSEQHRGYFGVLEGIGGSGKDTQFWPVVYYLRSRGLTVCTTRQHDRDSEYGQVIENLIHHQLPPLRPFALQLLYSVDGYNNLDYQITPPLVRGDNVFCNRNYPTRVAYSEPEYRQLILDVNQLQTPKPDRVFILDLDPVEAVKRVSFRGDGDIFDNVPFFIKAREGYRWYMENSGDTVSWIDASGSKEEVFERIKEILDQDLGRRYKN